MYKQTEIVLDFGKQFWGQYYGNFRDKFGHCWSIAAPVEPIKVNCNPRKRTMEEADISCDNNHTKKRKMDAGVDEIPQNGFLRMEDKEDMIVLVYSTIVGEVDECTHKCFGSAAKDGIDKLYGYLKKHKNLMNKAAQKPIGITPDDPKKIKKARYKPGFIINGCKSVDEIKLDDKDGSGKEFEVIVLPKNKWYIYQHVGSYDGLGVSWKRACDDIKERGLKIVGGLNMFEEYIDDPESVKEEALRTLIYFAI